MTVNLKLSTQTTRRLRDLAARQGQTLEGLLEHMAEQVAEASNDTATAVDIPDGEERPWRGIFALDYPRSPIFTAERDINVSALPTLPVEFNIYLRRLADDTQ